MVPLGRRLLVRGEVRVAVAILAGVLFAPTAARAQCGAYVVVGARAAGGHDQAPPAMAHAASDTRSDAPASPSRPCTGPMCSSAPLAMPVVPLSTPRERGEQWSSLTDLLGESAAGPAAFLADGPDQRQVHRTLSIYHPPRLPRSSA